VATTFSAWEAGVFTTDSGTCHSGWDSAGSNSPSWKRTVNTLVSALTTSDIWHRPSDTLSSRPSANLCACTTPHRTTMHTRTHARAHRRGRRGAHSWRTRGPDLRGAAANVSGAVAHGKARGLRHIVGVAVGLVNVLQSTSDGKRNIGPAGGREMRGWGGGKGGHPAAMGSPIPPSPPPPPPPPPHTQTRQAHAYKRTFALKGLDGDGTYVSLVW
jgi:hypothetical protein